MRSNHVQNGDTRALRHYSCERCEDAVIAGVCAGVAKRLDADPIVVRVTAVVLALCTCGLAIIPYVVCALSWPCERTKERLLDVAPLSVASERYQQVVQAFDGRAAETAAWAARADSGHVPPAPPVGGAAVSLPYPVLNSSLLAANARSRKYTPVVVSLALGIALVILFAFVALAVKRYVPTASLVGFWPLVALAVGIALFACPTERISLTVRLCVVLLCVEFCVAALPFTLSICPPVALYRLGAPSLLFAAISVACIVGAIAGRSQKILIAAVVFCAVFLLLAWGDVGMLDRISIIQNDVRRPIPFVPFK